MNNVDERLERIENRIEMLLERQRLSRFDNLMFLIYPLVILGITLSLSLSLQYETVKSIQVSGVPLVQLFDVFRILFPLGLGLTFLTFCLAYAMDKPGTRLVSLEGLIVILFALAVCVLGLLLTSWQILPGIFTVPAALLDMLLFGVALYSLFLEARGRFIGWVASWLEKSMPTTLKAAQVSLDTWHKPPRHRLVIKASWSMGLLVYFMILLSAAWRGQLFGRIVYDALYVSAFLLMTEAIVLWRL
jgi:hypothetical protein